MKTRTIFCVLAIVCLCGAGNADEDPEGEKLLGRLNDELEKQLKGYDREFGPLVDNAHKELKTAAAAAKKSGRNDQALCLENAAEVLKQAQEEFRNKLDECKRKTMTESEPWISKRRRNTSTLEINLFVTRQLLNASLCNKHGGVALRLAIKKARPSVNKRCSSKSKVNTDEGPSENYQ